jgi:transketolase
MMKMRNNHIGIRNWLYSAIIYGFVFFGYTCPFVASYMVDPVFGHLPCSTIIQCIELKL